MSDDPLVNWCSKTWNKDRELIEMMARSTSPNIRDSAKMIMRHAGISEPEIFE